jgi:phosphoglycerol transferase
MDNQSDTKIGGGLGSRIVKVLFYILIALLILLFAVLIYMRNTWPYVSYAELLFHLKTSFDGTNPEMIYQPLLQYGVPAVFGFIVITLILKAVRKNNQCLYRVVALVMLLVLLCLLLIQRVYVEFMV